MGDLNLENSLDNLSDKDFAKYIQTLDVSASCETVNKCVKVRQSNKKLIEDLKERAGWKCQICGWGNENNLKIVDAHHIKKFSLTQNNKPDNILILCPNHHRLIDKTNAVINRETCEVDYQNGQKKYFVKLY